MPKFLILLLTVFLIGKTTPPCKVIAIADGDTFTILQDNTPVRIRIDAIDAPEKGMPFGKASKKYLSALCFGKFVTIKATTTDRYGRTVARAILPDGRDISTEMIRAGFAWHYKKYSKDQALSRLEIEARQQKLGLWKDANPIAPWEIRKMHRKGISTKQLLEADRQ
ncbi:MAG TPA: thermonuclease family protein [Flavobacterium sp.]|nr:thermonuclease family protein [Flavobacterium sp.]